MNDAIIERLELKLAYLESTNQQLSDIVYRHQRDIDNLRAQMSTHQRQLDAWRAEQSDTAPVDERPPHY